MPIDALLMTIVVVAIFVTFAAALAWRTDKPARAGSTPIPSAEAPDRKPPLTR